MPSSSRAVPAEDLPVIDLHWVLEVGLGRGAPLLTAGEQVVVRRILGLTGPAARLYARLTGRKPIFFRVHTLACPGVDDPDAAADALEAAGLADRLVPWDRRAEACTSEILGQACRTLGLRHTGRRAERIERLQGHTHWLDARWIRVRHRGLVRRLERWAFLHRRPERAMLVVERLGHIRWPDYPLTPGTGLHATRRALRRWEALLEAAPELTPEACLAALEQGIHRAPGRLDQGRSLTRRVLEAARQQEREGSTARARALYQGLVDGGHLAASAVAVRVARTLEAEGRGAEALTHLSGVRDHAAASDQIAISRTGRRLARQLRAGWAPDPPLRAAGQRTLRLPRAEGGGSRPRWRVGERDLLVEAAVAVTLREAGRPARFSEGAVWTTLFALLLAEAYFLPIPGALPVPFLSGPLDLGTPAFRKRRAQAVDEVLEAVAGGQAPARIRAADRVWRDTRLAGATWSVADGETLARVAEGVGPSGLTAILEILLASGGRGAGGLPDLVVLPGARVTVPALWPSTVSEDLHLVEVKGPGDTLRDEQLVWLDRLNRAGVAVEVWQVGPAPTRPGDIV